MWIINCIFASSNRSVCCRTNHQPTMINNIIQTYPKNFDYEENSLYGIGGHDVLRYWR